MSCVSQWLDLLLLRHTDRHVMLNYVIVVIRQTEYAWQHNTYVGQHVRQMYSINVFPWSTQWNCNECRI